MPDQLPSTEFAGHYQFYPAPYDHPLVTDPPLDSTYAVHLFYYPTDCHEASSGQVQDLTFLQIPKRLQHTLKFSTVLHERIGFGMLIKDKLSIGVLVVLLVITATFSGLSVGIAMTCKGYTAGDAFTVAAWPVAIIAIIEAGWLVYISQP